LARVYLHAWQVTGEPFYHAIVTIVLVLFTSTGAGVPCESDC